jgi:DNA repair protein RecO (recombination protein O)
MEWREEALVISVRPHGESAAILQVFSNGQGRHAGVVRGGAGRRLAPVLQPGAQVLATWRARLDDHIGVFTVEPLRSRAGLMADRGGLAGLVAVCAMLQAALPERAPHPGLWPATMDLLARIEGGGPWAEAYLQWEVALLEAAGFALDLTRCAVTGGREGLAWVSPRTGRAVSRQGAAGWEARLLPLPAFLGGPAGAGSLGEGAALTGHFLTRALAPRAVPEARGRLVDLLTRAG